MVDNKFELQVFCTEHNLIRSTYFSDTYRATFELDGITKSWDITHISLPFSEEKERLLQARFGIPSDELFEFYKRFAKCVQNSMAVVKYINDIPLEEQSQNPDGTPKRDPAVAVKSSAALYKYKRIIKKADKHGSDVYLVTEPLDPFVGSEFCTGTAISLSNLLSFAARATQIINGFAYYGFHVGGFDLDTIFFQNIDGKKFFTFGSFLYAGFDQDHLPTNRKGPAWPDMKGLPTLPASTDQGVKEGGAPSLVGDMHSLVALLWTMLSGKNYRDPPNYEEAPCYAPAELLEVLVQGRDSDDPDTLRVMSKRFHALMRSIRRQELPDTIIHMAEPPDYLAEYLAEQEDVPAEEEQPAETSSDADNKSEVKEPQEIKPESEGEKPKTQEVPAADTDKGDGQPGAAAREASPETPIHAEIVAEVVAVTVPTALAAKAVSEQLTAEKPSGGESDNTTPLEEVKSETAEPHQEAPSEPPQKAEAPGMGADTQQAVESHTGSPEGVEMPSDGPVTDGDTSEQENEILEAAVTELEQSSQSDVESHEDSTSATESESPETAPPEPKEETAVVPSSEPHEEPAVQEVPSEPEEVVQEAKQEVSQHDSNPPQKPAKEQPEVQKEDAAPPAGITSPTAGQPSMFQGPIFIPVPYVQPGGQQGFMAVYPPQVMTGQQGVTPAVQPVAVPQTVPAPATQPQAPQQTTAAEPATPPAVPKTQPVVKKPSAAPAPAAKQEQTPPPAQATAPKPAQKVIRRTVTTYRKPKKQSKAGTFFLVLLLVAILAFLGMCAAQYMGYDVPYDIPFIDELRGVADFTVTPESVTIHVGEEVVLTSSEGCTLSSSDHNVAVVSDTGHVRGIGPGTCTITARASSSSSVVRIPVTVLQGSA